MVKYRINDILLLDVLLHHLATHREQCNTAYIIGSVSDRGIFKLLCL